MSEEQYTRIESRLEITTFIQDIKYALNHGARIDFQIKRLVDENRDEHQTNQYTIGKLFPDENPKDALKRELMTLSEKDYMQTVKDIRFPKRSEMREFGKTYSGEGDVYIKIRVELLGEYGSPSVFVMSFHFSDREFTTDMFPYRKE
ncbi:MAG: hypothetical protein J5819_02715 [Eubacterium sp.]|nr:hypothetical protein [Eubacterium sp.]